MTFRCSVRLTVLLVVGAMLAACHVAGHLPPGQVKHVLNPPPSHGGTPPGLDRRGK